VFVGIFQKHLVQHLVVITEGTGRAVNLLLVYLFIRRNLSLPYFILALVLGNGVNFFLTFFLAKRYEKFGIAFDLKEWKKILYLSWPLAFSVILNLVYFKTDTIILSIFHSQEAVGIYSLPYKILETLLAFPAMFVGLVMPLLSYHAFATWDRFRRYLQRSFDALLLIDILMVITTLFFARQIVDLLKGQQNYYDSPRLLQILIFAAGTIFMGTLFGYAVVAINKQKEMIKGYLLGAVVGLILYFALIPKFSYWGAAIGTVVTEITVASFAYYLVRQGSGQKISLRILVPASPGIAILLLFYWLVKLPWIPEIILGCMIYTGALILFKAVPAQFINEVIFRE
jgi:O-antigen/teichoic acid export membrane protein